METTRNFLLLIVIIFYFYRVYDHHNNLLCDTNNKQYLGVDNEWLLRKDNTFLERNGQFGKEGLAGTILSPNRNNKQYQIRHYGNISTSSVSVVVLMLSGDVSPNPGPPTYPCTSCQKGVRRNSKAIECDTCSEWTHLNCQSAITKEQYDSAQYIDFICDKCSLAELPNSESYQDPDSSTSENEASFTEDPVSVTDSETITDYDQYDCFKNRGLHFIHLNSRSILPKLDEIHLLAKSTNAAVVAVTETWLDSSVTDQEVAVPGYSIERRDRNREGGGVALYIRNNIAYNRRDDLMGINEFCAVDLLLPKSKPILVGVAYRPQSDYNFYNDIEDTFLASPNFIQQETYIMGDFNTDVAAKKNNSLKKAMCNFMKTFDLSQIINEPTRVTTESQTILDLIFCSDVNNITQSGVLPCKISDHNVVFCTRKVSKGFFNKHNVAKIRCMKNYDSDVFVDKLNSVNWFEEIETEDVNIAWSNFSKRFIDVIDSVAPVKAVRIKQNTEHWFNGEILNLISKRDKAWYQFRKDNSSESFQTYKTLRNKTQITIKKAKKDFIRNEIAENQNAPKKLWRTLKGLGLPSSKGKGGSMNIGLKNDSEEIIFESEYVANKFNDFFCGIAKKLVEKLPKRNFDEEKIKDFYHNKGVKDEDFTFTVIDEESVEKLLKALNVTKATGYDNIASRFLKDGAKVVASPLTCIINLSLRTSTVPQDLKVARVVPLYKKGDKNFEGNYRPVSILPVFSKIMERVVYDKVYQYLTCNNILYTFQSGFRASFSTDTALTYLCDSIRFNMDAGLYTGVVLIDLQKAFDTVDHAILSSKLNAIGMSGPTVTWFESYLSQRSQFVEVGESKSNLGSISCGVPQGSILGPLLFSIYVNDMCQAVKCNLYLYADDSALVVSGKDPKIIEQELSQYLQDMSLWLEENKLSLHLGKTESIIFASNYRLSKCNSLQISCNSNNIKAQSSVKYLGVTMDQNMNSETMGSSVAKKINTRLKFLYRKGLYFGYRERKMLVSALVQPCFDYACNSWFRGLASKLKIRLQCAQNKLIRYIMMYDSRKHLYVDDFKTLGWLDVEQRVNYLTLGLMYSINNNTAPAYLRDLELTSHSYSTRCGATFILPHVKSQGAKSFKYNGIKLWNSLPSNTKTAETKVLFKCKCKYFLMNNMQDKENSMYVM